MARRRAYLVVGLALDKYRTPLHKQRPRVAHDDTVNKCNEFYLPRRAQRLAILLSGVFRLAFQSPKVTINNATRRLGDILLRAAAEERNREEIHIVIEKNGFAWAKKKKETVEKEEACVVTNFSFKVRYFVTTINMSCLKETTSIANTVAYAYEVLFVLWISIIYLNLISSSVNDLRNWRVATNHLYSI